MADVKIIFTEEEYNELVNCMSEFDPQYKRWFQAIEEQQEERNRLHDWKEIVIDGETVQYSIELFARVNYSGNKLCNLIIKYNVDSKLASKRMINEIEKLNGRMIIGDHYLHREFGYYYYVAEVLVEDSHE